MDDRYRCLGTYDKQICCGRHAKPCERVDECADFTSLCETAPPDDREPSGDGPGISE